MARKTGGISFDLAAEIAEASIPRLSAVSRIGKTGKLHQSWRSTSLGRVINVAQNRRADRYAKYTDVKGGSTPLLVVAGDIVEETAAELTGEWERDFYNVATRIIENNFF